MVFLRMVPSLDEDELNCSSLLGKPDQVHESTLGELVYVDIPHPNKESHVFFLEDARKLPKALMTIKSYSRIELEHLEPVLVNLN